MTPTLYIIRGPPGSGKSTLAEWLKWVLDAEHIEADMFFHAGGQYVFDASRLSEAHAWCCERAAASLAAGRTTIVANTFTRGWELAPYLKMVPPTDLRVLRCYGRFANSHGVPPADTLTSSHTWQCSHNPNQGRTCASATPRPS